MYKNLFRPFSYLFIGHTAKWRVDWIYPALLSAFTVIAITLFKETAEVNVFGEGGIIGKVLGFIQGLPGFYIAALAAIATFNKLDIDKTMPAPAPTIGITIQGRVVEIELTRRRFLCSMFAFLTAENVVLVIMSVFGQSLAPAVKHLLGTETASAFASPLFLFVYCFLFWQMIVVTFWGLYYLGDKLHQPDP